MIEVIKSDCGARLAWRELQRGKCGLGVFTSKMDDVVPVLSKVEMSALLGGLCMDDGAARHLLTDIAA